MVKRYVWDEEGCPPDGMELVAASDYDAAQARIRELEAEVRALRSAGYSCPTCGNDAVDSVAETDCVHDFRCYAINNAESPLDTPDLCYTPVTCIKCGIPAPTEKTGADAK